MRRVARVVAFAVGAILAGVPAGAAGPVPAGALPFGGHGGLWPLPAGEDALAIRLVRITVAPGGTWVVPGGDRFVLWVVAAGVLSFHDPGAGGAWQIADEYTPRPPADTTLTNRARRPAVVLELRIERGDGVAPAGTELAVEPLAGGSVGPMSGRLAAVAVESVALGNWAAKIADTARDGAALVVVETGVIDVSRDGGWLETGAAGDAATPVPDHGGPLRLEPGDWALLGHGAAFHVGAADQARGATALVVTVSPNAAVVQEHE